MPTVFAYGLYLLLIFVNLAAADFDIYRLNGNRPSRWKIFNGEASCENIEKVRPWTELRDVSKLLGFRCDGEWCNYKVRPS